MSIDPNRMTKEELKRELVSHSVDLPSPSSRKGVYVSLYRQHVLPNQTSEFSSDEESFQATPKVFISSECWISDLSDNLGSPCRRMHVETRSKFTRLVGEIRGNSHRSCYANRPAMANGTCQSLTLRCVTQVWMMLSSYLMRAWLVEAKLVFTGLICTKITPVVYTITDTSPEPVTHCIL